MWTAFDDMIDAISQRRYHNHRREEHSNLVAEGIWADLLRSCPELAEDYEADRVTYWVNVPAPGLQERKADLLVGEIDAQTSEPDLSRVRICMENKSVITAHRNKNERFRDLNNFVSEVQTARQEAIVIGTVVVGTARRVLNVPDRIKPLFKRRPHEFTSSVLPRLSSGDEALWVEFDSAVSENRPNDPAKTVKYFLGLPTRNPAGTHGIGFDALLIVPAHIDNVGPPSLARDNALDIDIDGDYERMLNTVSKAYRARFHF